MKLLRKVVKQIHDRDGKPSGEKTVLEQRVLKVTIYRDQRLLMPTNEWEEVAIDIDEDGIDAET